jgi:serine protease Do
MSPHRLVRVVVALVLALASALVLPSAASAQSARDSARGADVWYGLTLDNRLLLQLHMTAAGFWPSVPNVDWSDRLQRAIADVQRARGAWSDGVLAPQDVDAIIAWGGPVLEGWDLARAHHPTHGRWLLVPTGLDLQAGRTPEGALIRSADNRFRLSFEAYDRATLSASYRGLRDEMVRSGDVIEFEVLRDDFFVLSTSQGRFHRYVRFHRDGAGMIGFDMNWSEDGPPVYGERLATVISGSFRAAVTGAPYPPFDPIAYPWEEEPPAVSALPQPGAPSRAAPSLPQGSGPRATGTGFFVTDLGHVLTNEHVVEGCGRITVRDRAGRVDPDVAVLARDAAADLALLRTELRGVRTLALRPGVRLGESVAAYGFPLAEVLASSGNFTLGNVTALAGVGDDERVLQMSAPVQSGNSGGPLLDAAGNVVGVVVAKFGLRAAQLSGDLPQNVNFAVKAGEALRFLKRNGVAAEVGRPGVAVPPEELAEAAQEIAVFVVCE